jgi:general secretion pathway protein K
MSKNVNLSKNSTNARQQRGVALITAVLIVSLVTVAATAMAARQLLDIRRTENILHSEQAYVYALAAEEWARQVLAHDQDKNVDYEGEDWATLLPPIPVPGGSIQGGIKDATAAFPINDVVDAGGQKREPYRKALQRLIDTVLADSFSPDLANAVLDWVDPDQNVSAGGAEDNDYLNLKVPYRAANGPIASVSELRLINNLSADDYAKLVPHDGRAPFINALPIDTPININTAPKEVIMSLHNKIDEQMANDIIKEREDAIKKNQAPYTDVKKFTDEIKDRIFGVNPTDKAIKKQKNDFKFDASLLSVGSQYFEVTAIANIGRTEVQLHSLLKRDGNTVTTLRRGIGVE